MTTNSSGKPTELAIRFGEFRHYPHVSDKHQSSPRLLALYAGVFATYVALRMWRIGDYSPWYDEVFSLVVAKSDWTVLLRQVIVDRIHPPVFYVLLKLWIGVIGGSIVKLRLFALLSSVLMLFPLWNCLKHESVAPRVRLALLFAIACNPFLIFYSQEIRMYSLLALFSVWSFQLYLRLGTGSRLNRYLWASINVLMVMTHIAGLAVVLCELAHAAFIRRGFKSRVLLCLPSLLVFIIWMVIVRILAPAPTAVIHNVSWIPRPTVGTEWKTLAHLLGGGVAVLGINLAIALALWTKRRLSSDSTLLYFELSILTIAAAFIFSLVVVPVSQERYLIVAVVPYYLLGADSIRKLSPKRQTILTLVIALAGFVSLFRDLTHHPDRPNFDSFEITMGQPMFASTDIIAAPLSLSYGSHTRVSVLKAVGHSNPQALQLIVRDVAYSVGERDFLRTESQVSRSEFFYAYDVSSDELVPPGISPSSFWAFGCSENKLASTSGQGHQFTLFKIKCS